MSPKSKGRPPARGRAKPRPDRPLRTPTAVDRVVNSAAELAREDLLDAEVWASAVLGSAWASAPSHDPEPELRLLTAVADRARQRPGLAPAAAVAALARLLDPETPGLDALLDALPALPWSGAKPWSPTRARVSDDVWGSSRLVLVQFAGPQPHVLLAGIERAAGVSVGALEILEPTGFDTDPTYLNPAMGPAVDCLPAVALAELAAALHEADRDWPRFDDPDYTDLRALAWSRCRAHLAVRPPYVPVAEAERAAIVSAFVEAADVGDSKVVRSLAGYFVDFGDAWLPDGPLSWSPGAVEYFFRDELPRSVLEDDEYEELPDVLAEFVRYALAERGVADEWSESTVAAVALYAEELDAENGIPLDVGPEEAREIFGTLLSRGVDLTDNAAVDRALREIAAERGLDRDNPF